MNMVRFRAAFQTCAAVLFLLACLAGQALANEALTSPTGVLKYDPAKAFDGYTLISPMVNCKTTYLIDMAGNVVHKWDCAYVPGLYAELLPNGNLLRGGRPDNPPVKIGGAAGVVQEIDWDGHVVWEYKMLSPTEVQHHTFHRMPNGNTLILGWEKKTKEEALAKGRDPKTIPAEVMDSGLKHDAFWPDFVREVDAGGKTVWEWHVWDHLGTGPDQINLNYVLPMAVGEIYATFDWTHCNTVDYIPATDQILLNSRNFGEFYLINHKTGAIEYRWGNPTAHGQGKKPSFFDDGDQVLFGPHCAIPLDNGHVLIFDNGSERPEQSRSRAVEMDPKSGKIVWEYAANVSTGFYAARQGAVQRLSNGNTLITSSANGHVFEVTPDKKVVWEFVSPIVKGQAKCIISDEDDGITGDHGLMFNTLHRAYRYAKDYPGLKGRDLSVKGPLAPGCPVFFKDYKQGAALAAPAPAPAPAAAPAAPAEDGPTMKTY